MIESKRAAFLMWGVIFSLAGGGNLFGEAKGVVNVYSHRHYESDRRLYELFEQMTSIRVNIVKAGADQLIERLRVEGRQSPADILITVDAGRLYKAKSLGLLQPVSSELLEANIPPHLRDPEGNWFGLTQRTRVIVYHKDRVQPNELSGYEDLVDEKWRGRLLVRSSSNIYNQSLLAAMIAKRGPADAKKWAEGIVRNMARRPRGNDRDQMKAIAAGLGDIAIVNSYYLGLLLNSENEEERKVGQLMGVHFPGQRGSGVHVNVSGAGVTASSKNRENAIKLLEFLSGDRSQQVFADANFEYPVKRGVPWSELLTSWGEFRADEIDLSLLGKHNSEAVRIFNEVGWR